MAFSEEFPPCCETYIPSNGWGVSVKGEGLYWTASESSLAIGISDASFKLSDRIPPGLDRWDFHGKVLRIKPSWNFGFRLALGYTSQCDYWDIFTRWTSFGSDGKKEADIIELPGVPLWGYPDAPNASLLYAAKGKWKLEYNLFDGELGRAFWVGNCLTFRPHFGVQAGWIDQNIDLFFDFRPQNEIPFGSILPLRCDFSGAGLRTGFDLQFMHSIGIGLYGKIAFSLLYGKFQSHFQETETYAKKPFGPINQQVLIADSKDHFHMGLAGCQGIIGMNWDQLSLYNWFHFNLFGQWEFNLWNGLNKFNHFSHHLHKGLFREENSSLTLMGFSFGGGIVF